jgi:hypothetical protein
VNGPHGPLTIDKGSVALVGTARERFAATP